MEKFYYQPEDFEQLKTAQSYTELFKIAKNVLSRIPRPIAQMCGPISTGGAGSVEKNLARMTAEIEKLEAQGIKIFNQMPFEDPMVRIIGTQKKDGYAHDLLNEFYLPIFEQKLVDTLYFLPDWQSSTGATWEHAQATRLGLNIKYL